VPAVLLLRVPGDRKRAAAAGLPDADATDRLRNRPGNAAGPDHRADHRGDPHGLAFLWWFLDPCCRPTRCELSRILFWVFSWALLILGIIAIFCTLLVIPFGLAYLLAQQFFLRMINDGPCGPPPDIFSWPFPACR